MRKKYFIFLFMLSFQFYLAFWQAVQAQNDNPFTMKGKMSGEFRDNIVRYPDSLKKSDYRTNLFFTANYRNRMFGDSRADFSYELRYHRYAKYREFRRHDHLLRAVIQKPLYSEIKLHLSNEFRVRFYPFSHSYNYQRNILNIYLSSPVPIFQQTSFGYQNWLKAYPNSNQFQNFISNRFYLKIDHRLGSTINLGLKFEFQIHRGNLYPGSTAPDQVLNLNGERQVLLLVFDKIFNRKLIANLAFRYENDYPDEPDVQETGEHTGDENAEELLAEDSDFGYFKNQASLSLLLKINSRISLMTFSLFQSKKFRYWRISPEGERRYDKLIFMSHILKFKVYKNVNIELKYNYENNHTNLDFYRYKMNSVSLGLSYHP